MPIGFSGNPVIAIPLGLVDGPISARAIDHIWVSKKANWLDLSEIGALPAYDAEPT